MAATNAISTDRFQKATAMLFSRNARLFCLAILFGAALALTVGQPDWVHFGEEPQLAASLAEGHGFSSPFMIPTGPSAFAPPLYPFLLAIIFRVFGVFTTTSYWAAVALNVIAHAASCVLLYSICKAVFDDRSAVIAAAALATFPLIFQPLLNFHFVDGAYQRGMFITPVMVWYTTLSELMLLCLIWMTLRQSRWLPYGVMWGIATLLNPTILSVMPFFLLWRIWQTGRFRPMLLTVVVMLACISPWLIRNYVVFHRFVFIRDGLGLEIRQGNEPGSHGLWKRETHPDINVDEARKVAQMGEANYLQMAGKQAIGFIKSDPGEFVINCLLRVRYYWIGTPVTSQRLRSINFVKYAPPLLLTVLAFWGGVEALRRRNRAALLLFAVLIFYPVVYYISHTFFGFFYQYTIQAEMLGLAASGLFAQREPLKDYADSHGSDPALRALPVK